MNVTSSFTVSPSARVVWAPDTAGRHQIIIRDLHIGVPGSSGLSLKATTAELEALVYQLNDVLAECRVADLRRAMQDTAGVAE